MSHIFISYSRQNEDYVRSLKQRLIAEGYDVWMDDRIHYGEDWWRVIVKAIRECAAFVVVMSFASEESRWVQREVKLADELRKPAFPLLLEGSLIDFEHFLIYISTQYVDVTDGQLPGDSFFAHLAMAAPRRQTPGQEVATPPENLLGVRYDGVYRWQEQHNKTGFADCLKFNEDMTVIVFVTKADETVTPAMVANMEVSTSYQSEQGKIQMKLPAGRAYIGQIQNNELILRVEYPRMRPEFRVYKFFRFG